MMSSPPTYYSGTSFLSTNTAAATTTERNNLFSDHGGESRHFSTFIGSPSSLISSPTSLGNGSSAPIALISYFQFCRSHFK
jgi:hypothetical protein